MGIKQNLWLRMKTLLVLAFSCQTALASIPIQQTLTGETTLSCPSNVEMILKLFND